MMKVPRIKVVERGGVTLQRMLCKANPYRGLTARDPVAFYVRTKPRKGKGRTKGNVDYKE